MCLGVPGRVVRWVTRDSAFAEAEIEFDGIRRRCQMACVPEVNVGDYVIIHAGIAICQVDAQEAERVFEELRRLDLIDDIESDSPPSARGETGR